MNINNLDWSDITSMSNLTTIQQQNPVTGLMQNTVNVESIENQNIMLNNLWWSMNGLNMPNW